MKYICSLFNIWVDNFQKNLVDSNTEKDRPTKEEVEFLINVFTLLFAKLRQLLKKIVKMAKLPKNLNVVKNAVMLNKRRVQVREWLKYFKTNWYKLTENLQDATILIIGGRHGNEDGSIGPQEDVLILNHENLVSF